MTKEEIAFEAHLQEQFRQGRLKWISSFEPLKLVLAERCTFTVDFMAVAEDDVIDIYDVKGRKVVKERDPATRKVIAERETYWVEEDSKLKIRLAAALAFPIYRFFIVWPRRDGSWAREVF